MKGLQIFLSQYLQNMFCFFMMLMFIRSDRKVKVMFMLVILKM